ncbi:MAG: RimK/LysX family protein [Planctomycetota bacterium]
MPLTDPPTATPDSPHRSLVTVGWKERVGLPGWGVRGLKAKIDTGARTSSIHVAELELRGDDTVRFEVVVREKPVRKTVWVEAPLVRHTVVKPSSGQRQERPVVATTLSLGGRRFPIEATLVCRKGMLCRMLVGRTALAGRFAVDPSATYLHRKPKNLKP